MYFFTLLDVLTIADHVSADLRILISPTHGIVYAFPCIPRLCYGWIQRMEYQFATLVVMQHTNNVAHTTDNGEQ